MSGFQFYDKKLIATVQNQQVGRLTDEITRRGIFLSVITDDVITGRYRECIGLHISSTRLVNQDCTNPYFVHSFANIRTSAAKFLEGASWQFQFSFLTCNVPVSYPYTFFSLHIPSVMYQVHKAFPSKNLRTQQETFLLAFVLHNIPFRDTVLE